MLFSLDSAKVLTLHVERGQMLPPRLCQLSGRWELVPQGSARECLRVEKDLEGQFEEHALPC